MAPTAGGEPGHGTLDLGRTISLAWEIYQSDVGMFIAAILVPTVINFAVGQGAQYASNLLLIAGAPFEVAIGVSIVAQIAASVLQIWLSIGLARYLLARCRGEKPEFISIFGGGRWLLRSVLAGLLALVAILPIAAVCFAATGILVLRKEADEIIAMAALGGGLVFTLIMVVLSLTYGQYFYMILDRDARVIQSFIWSAQVTRGNRVMMFATGLVLFLIYLGSLMACCLPGILVGLPILQLGLTLAYMQMCGEPIMTPQQRNLPRTIAPPNFDGPR